MTEPDPFTRNDPTIGFSNTSTNFRIGRVSDPTCFSGSCRSTCSPRLLASTPRRRGICAPGTRVSRVELESRGGRGGGIIVGETRRCKRCRVKFDRRMNALAVITCFCYTYHARLTVKWNGISKDNLSTRASKHLEELLSFTVHLLETDRIKICQRTPSICKQIMRICRDFEEERNSLRVISPICL